MTIDVDLGRKATKPTNQQFNPNINHVFDSSKAVLTAGALSSQYQAAKTLCKQSYVDTQNTIKIHNIEMNPLAMIIAFTGCPVANNKA